MSDLQKHDQPRSLFIPSWDRFLFFVAILTVTVCCNFRLFKICEYGSMPALIGVSALFAVQIGLMALFCGYGGNPVWLRWSTMIWVFALVDLQLFSLGVQLNYRKFLPIVSLFASQYGLVLTWMVMGSTHFIKRISLALAMTALLAMASVGVVHGMWGTILAIFLVALLATLLILRYFGFRLTEVDSSAEQEGLHNVQFSLRHALILTTVLSMIMGVLKSQEAWVQSSFQGALHVSNIVLLALAIASAIGVALACWAALGYGRSFVRFGVLLVGTLSMGVAMTLWFQSIHNRLSTRVGRFNEWEFRLLELSELKWQWVAWFVISGLMLVASLAFFRIQGMRFARAEAR